MDERLSAEAVENLVTQFSSALDFYRELVQNSIDAGSSSIEAWTEYIEANDGGGEGVIALHLDDFGEGMNEEIIDEQLTQLFASAKEDDLTKIGKFGIGFVSVFAMKPKAVLVHTGRSGEYWEVLFHEDRSFTKTRVDDPVEGTQVTLFVEGDYSRYRDIVEGSRATLARWCAHSDTEITFEDRSARPGDDRGIEPVNAAFASDGECPTQSVQPDGTVIALAYHERPLYGFYNKGLALAVSESGDNVMGTHAGRFAAIAFKIKSRYLEHTLSRETVMRDENFEKAMAMVHGAADGPLRAALVEALASLAASREWSLANAARYRRALGFLAAEPDRAWKDEVVLDTPCLRTVDGRPVSPRAVLEAYKKHGRAYVAADATPLTAAVAEQGSPVLLSDRMPDDEPTREDPTTRLLVALFTTRGALTGLIERIFDHDALAEAMERIVHPERVLFACEPIARPPSEIAELLYRAGKLLDKARAGYKGIVLGKVAALHQETPMFVLGPKVAPLMARPPQGRYQRGRFDIPYALVHGEHPHFRALVQLYGSEPELATYCLAKSLLLEEDRGLDKDIRLVELVTKAQRLEGIRR